MGIPVLVIISTLVKTRTKSNIALKPFDIFIKICIKKARSKFPLIRPLAKRDI